MTLKLGLQHRVPHRVLKYNHICSNDDTGFDLDHFYDMVKFVS